MRTDRTFRYCLILWITCGICAAQSLSIGVIAGGRPTDDVSYAAIPQSKRYVVGPMIEAGLPFGLALEFNALYHRHGYSVANGNFAGYIVEKERANSWEFPILLKYKLPLFNARPFVEAGVAPRTISGNIAESGASINIVTGQQTPFIGNVKTNWSASVGVVAGGGVQFGVGHLQFSPEVRYTHWTSTPVNGYFGDGPSYQSTQDQVDILIGIGWKMH